MPSCHSDLEWKLIYVGSAYDQQKDQVSGAPVAAVEERLTFVIPCALAGARVHSRGAYSSRIEQDCVSGG